MNIKETLSQETLSFGVFVNKEDSNQSDSSLKVAKLSFSGVINIIAVLCICCLHESQVGTRHILLKNIYTDD